MKKVSLNGLAVWQFKSLEYQSRIKHFVTDRNSAGPENEFSLSLSSSPNRQAIIHNRSMLAHALGIEPSKLLFPSQVHQTKIVCADHQTPRESLMDTDALITAARGLAIAVMSADCVPVLLYDTENNAVAAVHSGWRGTVARILEKTLLQMQRVFGTRGRSVIACIGPSICQEVYEVGEEVVEEVYAAFGEHSGLLIPQENRKARLDLWRANELQLLEFGVPLSNIETGSRCTVRNNNHFFSARKGDTGRFAAGIMLV